MTVNTDVDDIMYVFTLFHSFLRLMIALLPMTVEGILKAYEVGHSPYAILRGELIVTVRIAGELDKLIMSLTDHHDERLRLVEKELEDRKTIVEYLSASLRQAQSEVDRLKNEAIVAKVCASS